jgi:hypothetical protein
MADRRSVNAQINDQIKSAVRRAQQGSPVKATPNNYSTGIGGGAATDPQVFDADAIDTMITEHDDDTGAHGGVEAEVVEARGAYADLDERLDADEQDIETLQDDLDDLTDDLLAQSALIKRDGTRAPLPTDDVTLGYTIASEWFWGIRSWVCFDGTTNSAVWVERPWLAAALAAGRLVTVDANGRLTDSGDGYLTGGLGVGVAPEATIAINAYRQYALNSGTAYGLIDIVEIAPTTTGSATLVGNYGVARTIAGNANRCNQIIAQYGYVQHNGTANFVGGLDCWRAAGNLASTSAGTIPLMAGINVRAFSKTAGSTATVTVAASLYMTRQIIGTSNYQIYSEGGMSLLLAGDAAIIPLILRAAASQSASIQEWQSSVGATLASIDANGVMQAAGYKSADGTAGATGSAGGANFKNGLYVGGTPDTSGNIPAGGIIMWSGAIAAIPTGWALCDGNNGTPDLRDRFVVGAGNSYAVGANGGEATHTLTTAEMPAHTHPTPYGKTYNFAAGGSQQSGYEGAMVSQDAGNATTSPATGSTGGDGAHNNLPPYYALCFIMKT